jgi:hypothetical protein
MAVSNPADGMNICVVNVVCCQVAVPATVRSFVQGSSAECVCVCIFITNFYRPHNTVLCVCLLFLICTFVRAPQLVCL